ncbi:MAG: transglycosylase domain-containing protein [Spirochaetaceae bacterium]|jgi:penicillin-binding protein 1C|nr:transglycosylase domain-containing protein [Spirochaetaceae bacterium]
MRFKFKVLAFKAGIIFALLSAVYLTLRLTPYPELEAFLARPFSTRVYDRNGILLQIVPLKDGLRREYIPLDGLAPGTADVFITAEDERFYCHFGIDLFAVVRAVFQNILAGRRVSGASTVTMQLARIIGVGTGDGFGRKIAEGLNALRLETRFTKKEILEMYLNSTPFGFQTEGLASAARNFFSVEAGMLTPAQIFCLAVIPRRPAAYNPARHPAECKNAAEALQKSFVKSFFRRKRFPAFAAISDGDRDFTVRHSGRFDYPFETPHLVRHVLGELVSGHDLAGGTKQRRAAIGGGGPGPYLGGSPQPRAGAGGRGVDVAVSRRPYGKRAPLFTKKTGMTGLSDLTLSVDIHLQHYLEGLIAENVERYSAERVNQGAAIVLDNDTGEVLAWVGSAAFNGSNSGQMDGVLALNQPGSSMKPFLYALALERGIEPNTVLADVPVSFGGEEIYIPQNFNNRFNGPATLRQALASSLNIPAVQLLYRLGVKDYGGFLSRLGFDSLGGEEGGGAAGLGLALGNAPVSIFELARAFSVFPNDGKLLNARFLFRDGKGGGETFTQGRVISPDTARIICAFLSDTDARHLAFGRARNFTADFPLIVKTGTANQYQSIVALAASRRFTGAVWMGNFSGETVIGKTGSSLPAELVRNSLVFLHENSTSSASLAFEEPEGFVKRPICAVSGLSPTEACMTVLHEYTDSLSAPPPCGWHRLENGRVTTRYPAEYQSWLIHSRRQGMVEHGGSELTIVTPRDGFQFFVSGAGENGAIPVEVIGGASDELYVFYDGERRVVRRPFRFFLPLERGRHTLTVRCGDESSDVVFTVS